jgi:GNAT superfamily N-acetyltransferase
MDTFSTAWNVRAFGFSEFLIAPDFRKRGFAKLFLQSILKHLRDNRVGVMEIHIDSKNAPARRLLECFRFTQVDVGRMYRLPPR